MAGVAAIAPVPELIGAVVLPGVNRTLLPGPPSSTWHRSDSWIVITDPRISQAGRRQGSIPHLGDARRQGSQGCAIATGDHLNSPSTPNPGHDLLRRQTQLLGTGRSGFLPGLPQPLDLFRREPNGFCLSGPDQERQ